MTSIGIKFKISRLMMLKKKLWILSLSFSTVFVVTVYQWKTSYIICHYRSAVFTSTGLQYHKSVPSTAISGPRQSPQVATRQKRPSSSELWNMLTTDKPIPTHGMTNISDLSRMKGKPENIQINPLPFNPAANQTSPSKQSLGMRTVIGTGWTDESSGPTGAI